MTEDAGLLTEWSRLLLGTLAQSGIHQVVVSPGSRSTPFTLAALRTPGFTCHCVPDERDAAFFALAQGKLTGRPSLLICTSGTAPAHYLPAIVEAKLSFTPLLVLSADRPFELEDCGAAQTVDQSHLFGAKVLAFVELGTPEASPLSLAALVRRAAQAVHTSRFPLAGPVHINARARKPLEPQPASETLRASVSALLEQGPPRASVARQLAPARTMTELAARCRQVRRGLIFCGAELSWRVPSRESVARLANLTGFPVLAESASQQRVQSPHALPLCDAHDLLLSVPDFATSAKPDLVLQIGSAPLGSALEALMASGPELHVMAAQGWPDPSQNARSIIQGDLESNLAALCAELMRTQVTRPSPSDHQSLAQENCYRSWWLRANQLAWSALEDCLMTPSSADPNLLGPALELTEAEVARVTAAQVPEGGVLAVGNSLCVRHLDTFCPAFQRDISIWTQRGANGIDGLVASAIGISALGRATTLLLGDVSLRHNLGALFLAEPQGPPLTVVVIHNGGGRIFEQLPVASAVSGSEMRFWTTPQDPDFASLAAAARIHHTAVTDRPRLLTALQEAQARRGLSLIEARVPPHGAVSVRARCQEAVRTALDPLLAESP